MTKSHRKKKSFLYFQANSKAQQHSCSLIIFHHRVNVFSGHLSFNVCFGLSISITDLNNNDIFHLCTIFYTYALTKSTLINQTT